MHKIPLKKVITELSMSGNEKAQIIQLNIQQCGISSSHGSEYKAQNLLGCIPCSCFVCYVNIISLPRSKINKT
jgi:hypothetical protein